MTENEAIDKLNNLHYKIVHTSFCNKVYESEIEALCMAKDCLKEIQQHRAIGTVEEFKDLKEKSVAKKVFDFQVNKMQSFCEDDFGREMPCTIKVFQFYCPNCNRKIASRFKINKCTNCNQIFDWE